MNNITGPPATGTNFFRRTSIIDDCWNRIPHGNILLTAPRRTGKTSIMLHLRDKPRYGYHGFYINVEDAENAADMVGALLHTYLSTHPVRKHVEAAVQAVKKYLPNAEIDLGGARVAFSRSLEDRWQDVGRKFLTILQELPESKSVLFLIDELPILLQRLRRHDARGADEAEQLLHWFRAVRTDPALCDGKVRFFLSGSIGLEGVVARLGLSRAINDLDSMSLPPLSPAEAAELVEALEQGPGAATLGQDARDKLLSLLEEPYPYYIQLLFQQVQRRLRRTDRPCTPELVQEAYDQDLLGHAGRKALRNMDERLDEALPPAEARRVRAVLDRACRDEAGLLVQTAYNLLAPDDTPDATESAHALYDLLLHDGYLKREGNRLRFRTRLLRDFWQKCRPQFGRTS